MTQDGGRFPFIYHNNTYNLCFNYNSQSKGRVTEGRGYPVLKSQGEGAIQLYMYMKNILVKLGKLTLLKHSLT